MISSKTVIGEPITVGDVTLVPIIKANFGFGLGGNDQARVSGGGGGANIMPIAVIVVRRDEVSVLSLEKGDGGGIQQLVEKLPGLLEKLPFLKGKKQQADAPSEEGEAQAE